MPRGESARQAPQQDVSDVPPPIPQEYLDGLEQKKRQQQTEQMDQAVDGATEEFSSVEDGEGPPPIPAEYLAAYEAEQRLKQEQQEQEDFLNRDPNVIRARADFAKVDAEMLKVYTQMTESPDAHKRTQAKRRYEKMCGVGINNPKNGEYNLAIAAMHRAEERSIAKFEAMKKDREAKGLQSALDKKTKEVTAIESQLGAGAIPVAELKQVADLMRDAVAANTDAEIANEKARGIPEFIIDKKSFEPVSRDILAPDARLDTARSETINSYMKYVDSLSVPDIQKTNTEFLLGLQQKGSELEQIAATLRAEMMKSPDTQAKKENMAALDALDKALMRKMDYINLLVGPLAHETASVINNEKQKIFDAAQKTVGEFRRTATMGFMVPYESRNDVKYLKAKHGEADRFADQIIAYKNTVEAQNLSDAQKLEVYEAIDGVLEQLASQIASIDKAVKEAEKNDFKEQSYVKSTTGEQLVRTTVGMHDGLAADKDRYKQMDDNEWFGQGKYQYDKNGDIIDPAKAQEVTVVQQKPKKGFFGSFGAKLAGGLASLAAAFSFGSSRAPERVQAPNFSESVKTASEIPGIRQTVERGETRVTTEAPIDLGEIAIKANSGPIDLGEQKITPRVQEKRVHKDHPLVDQAMKKISEAGVADTLQRDQSWRQPLQELGADIDRSMKGIDADLEKQAAETRAHVKKQEVSAPKVKVTKAGTRAFGSRSGDSLFKLPRDLQQPMREMQKDVAVAVESIDKQLKKEAVGAVAAKAEKDKIGKPTKSAKKTPSVQQVVQRQVNRYTKPILKAAGKQSKNLGVFTDRGEVNRVKVKEKIDQYVKPILDAVAVKSQAREIFAKEAGKQETNDISIAKREWQDASELLEIAKSTGQDAAIIAEYQQKVDTAEKLVKKIETSQVDNELK